MKALVDLLAMAALYGAAPTTAAHKQRVLERTPAVELPPLPPRRAGGS